MGDRLIENTNVKDPRGFFWLMAVLRKREVTEDVTQRCAHKSWYDLHGSSSSASCPLDLKGTRQAPSAKIHKMSTRRVPTRSSHGVLPVDFSLRYRDMSTHWLPTLIRVASRIGKSVSYFIRTIPPLQLCDDNPAPTFSSITKVPYLTLPSTYYYVSSGGFFGMGQNKRPCKSTLYFGT